MDALLNDYYFRKYIFNECFLVNTIFKCINLGKQFYGIHIYEIHWWLKCMALRETVLNVFVLESFRIVLFLGMPNLKCIILEKVSLSSILSSVHIFSCQATSYTVRHCLEDLSPSNFGISIEVFYIFVVLVVMKSSSLLLRGGTTIEVYVSCSTTFLK